METGKGSVKRFIAEGDPGNDQDQRKTAEVTEITTTEYENGEAKKVKAKFRVYSSYLEALSDYVGLLTRNPRYAAVTTAASAEQGAQALQDAGYATDPHYARKLTNMIQQMKSISDKVSKTYSMNIDNLF